jgi:thioesterase domain-containing protein
MTSSGIRSLIETGGSPEKKAALTSIWKEVLGRSDIGPNNDFFELGGDYFSAEELCSEIASRFGIELPSVMICQASTITSLAALLDQPQPVPIPALVRLNHGSSDPPLFVAHGLGDTAIALRSFVTSMGLSNPVLGMQAPGVDGVQQPLDRIEAMAKFFQAAIRQVQPHGPYFLIGYSLGGLVAFEIARQLTAQDERVGLLAMIDAYADRRYLSFPQRLRLTWQLIGRKLSKIGKSKHDAPKSISTKQKRNPNSASSRSAPTISSAMQPVKDAQRRALRNYQPTFFHGNVRFVKAATASNFTDDPAEFWAPLCEKFDLETMPGQHWQMITDNAETLASIVGRYIREATSQK